MIHIKYVRKEFDQCKILSEEELKRSNGYSEYANYIIVSKYEFLLKHTIPLYPKMVINYFTFFLPPSYENKYPVKISMTHFTFVKVSTCFISIWDLSYRTKNYMIVCLPYFAEGMIKLIIFSYVFTYLQKMPYLSHTLKISYVNYTLFLHIFSEWKLLW